MTRSKTTTPDVVDKTESVPTLCSVTPHCVLPSGHEDYCLDERPLAEELVSIVAAGPGGRDPGDTLSHRTANACVRFGWAERTECGNFAATLRGAFLASLDG